MNHVYLSMGSNVGDREDHLRRALDALDAPDLRLSRVSPLYETAPRDLEDQPWFLNLVAEFETGLSARQILERIQTVERNLGRQRHTRFGPRTLDIDILLLDGAVQNEMDLVIPHPRMTARRFVLEPLADLVPDLPHPVAGKSIRQLLQDVQDQEARRIPSTLPGNRRFS